ncbi:endonuclease/exonuclease/phosphatase family protein [Rhodoferax sp. U2-2l]|uniref:endonuclease/exonuclease/phosphatase family protein n=1 Tax=Rhodoferax sp. U2-2l TaxID=2884000 RepID=UPI001D0A181D|nr:endonuclease/exonuclease/phosphatase family protein [Rhodoferax sp. U2-2l]MCB8746552.1 endonuclease/exonuclease/phosphatase family protein [Rhodoferax sp. U2-2l]
MTKESLRIVTWNCNGALRKKWGRLSTFKADVYVVQECEDPCQANDAAYTAWCGNHLWTGTHKNKGIGVFASSHLTLQAIPLDLGRLELFLPCIVNSDWPLLATWTKKANSPNFGYIGQLWKFLQVHRPFLAHPRAMLIGDLNSNTQWDQWDRWWNHSDVVRELSELGLESCYHRHYSEVQGKETRPTFFLHRNAEKPYHIDYGFTGRQWTVRKVEVGANSDWLTESDHLPLAFDLERSE